MRILDGAELAGYIKERQAKQVRGLRQAWHTFPKLVIIVANENPVIDVYVRLKHAYGEDILVEVEVNKVSQSEVGALITRLNEDDSVHGIIVQLPLADPSETDEIVNLINPAKDVDGLGVDAHYVSATATAIDWLVAGYNINLKDKNIAIVGNGRLVGAPLTKLWLQAGHNVTTYDVNSTDLAASLRLADVIVTATGVPGLIKSSMVGLGKVLVDAGAALDKGVVVGDVAEDVRGRDDLTITPKKGGVGPLTITALFDNVINAAQKVASARAVEQQ